MIKILILLLPIFSVASSPFDSPKPNQFNTSMYDTKATKENKKVSDNKKVTCRWVCDKKVYKEQRISAAVSFYRESKNYKFTSGID